MPYPDPGPAGPNLFRGGAKFPTGGEFCCGLELWLFFALLRSVRAACQTAANKPAKPAQIAPRAGPMP